MNKNKKLQSNNNQSNKDQANKDQSHKSENNSSGRKSKKPNNEKKILSSVKKLLLFPGEEYEFDQKLIHYDAFGYSEGNLITKRCGILLTDEKGQAKDDQNEEVFRSLGRYYSPKEDDLVLGIIVQKSAEFYKIDINSYTSAILNTKDFEGATKKTKPNLNLGDLIFARVSKVNKFDTPMLSCISLHEQKNWASGESYFGVIKGGNLFNFDKLRTWDYFNDSYALNRLKDVVNYEIIIGFNGRMWIKSDTAEDIYTIYNILTNSNNKSDEEVEKIIHNTFIDRMKDH